jgi:ATP-dependent Zn protease
LVAYHEAGHAVAARVLGIEVQSVSIVEDKGTLGRSISPLPKDFDPYAEGAEEVMRSHLVAGVAGAASEELLTGELSSITGNDLEGATKLLMSLAAIGAQAQEDGEWARKKAKSTLCDNWESVQALAEALLEHGELDREQILAILG